MRYKSVAALTVPRGALAGWGGLGLGLARLELHGSSDLQLCILRTRVSTVPLTRIT